MNTHCSMDALESALAGNLPADAEARVQHHLDSCTECSAALEQLAGGTEWCREAAALLAGDELDAAVPAREEWSDVDFTVEHLEPSNEPNVLGRLGGYDVLEVIGRGGMSVVLKGYDRELKRSVAIKVLAPHLAQSSLAKKRFAREAQAAAAVVHPHVLAIHQVQAGGRLPFLVMPLVSGETLAARLAAQGTLELKEVLRIGMQAAAGLAAAHEQGLVHRDVKPANILLEKGVERAVLTDFGLARAGDDVALTRWGIIAGTPEYMSPEQARGEPLDGRSDLFSLGCVLYQMATGVSPFRADSVIATMRRLVDVPPQALASLNPELPPWFIAIVDRLLQKDPARRFGSAREVSELLEGCLAHVQQPASVRLPPGLSGPLVRRRWRPSIRGVLAMSAALGVGLLGIVLLSAESSDIAGEWSSEEWGRVVLKQTGDGEYTGTYSTTNGGHAGEIQLSWSRFERRFYGTWREGDDRFGELSVRLSGDEIRGAWTVDRNSRQQPGTPKLADLLWKRAGVNDGAPRSTPESGAKTQRLMVRSPEVAYLKGLHVKEGDFVKAGQLIATLGRITIPSTQEGGKTESEPEEMELRAPCDATVLKVYGQDRPPPVVYDRGSVVVELRVAQGPAAPAGSASATMPESEWGEPVGGVRIRASTVQQQWPADEPVELTLDLSNASGGQFGMARIPYCEVEVDGAWYVPALTERLVAGAYEVGQGIHERIAVVRLTRHEWVLKSAVKGDFNTDARAYFRELLLASADAANQLQLAAGKHTFRVACEVDGRTRLPVSQPVEIEVVATGKEAPSAGVDPLGDVAPEAPDLILTAEQAVKQGMELYLNRKQVTVRFRVASIQPRTVTDPDGNSSEWWNLHAESASDFTASLSPKAQAALGENGIAAAERRFTGKLVDVTGSVTGIGLDLVSRPDTIWTWQINVTSLDQIGLVDVANSRGEPDAVAARSAAEGESQPTVEASGIHVKLLLSAETHSRELMNRNVGFDGISLMGTGIHGTVEGKEHDNLVAVLAHNCRLVSFLPASGGDKRYWYAAFFVPQGPSSDGSNQTLSQERLDRMQEQGVQFTLDHTRDQPSSAPAQPHPQDQVIAPERLNYFTTGHDIRVACTPDGKLIAVANGNPTRIMQEGGTSRVKGNWKPTADVLDGQTGRVIAALKLTTADEDAVLAATERVSSFEVTAVAISPAGDLAAVGTSIGQVKLYRTRTGDFVRSLDDEAARLADKNIPEQWKPLRRAIGSAVSLAFSPDGRLLAVCGGSFGEFSDIFDTISDLTREVTGPGRLKVWDVKTGALTHDLVGHSDASAVAFSPDGNLLASAGSWLSPGGDEYGTGVILWNPQTGEKLRTISKAANGGTHAVAFSPNSKRIVFGATLFDNENATSFTAVNMAYALSGVVAWTQRVPGGATPVGFSPDGNSVLVRCQQSIRFLNAETGAVERELTSTDLSSEGHWDDIAIAPRAGRLVIGTVDEEEGNVALWNFGEPAAGAGSDSPPKPATDAP